MRGFIVALAAVAAGASLSGCATVTRGTNTKFSVESTPPGASVKTSSGFTCDQTPCSMLMPRKGSFDVTVTKAGYKPSVTHVASVVGGAGAAGFVGNALVGGVLGAGLDIYSGAMDDLKPNPLQVTLTPIDAAPAPVAAAAAPGPINAPATASPSPTKP